MKDCALGKIVEKIGPPEKIEMVMLASCIGPYVWTLQYFHYLSRGFSYSRACDQTQDCFTFHYADIVAGKEFYPSNKIVKDSLGGFNMAILVYDWHGFDVDIEEIENKMPDIKIETATPMP